MNVVNINGRKYTAPDGCSVSVINNKVYFNGKLAEDFNDWRDKNIEIKIEGNCAEVKTDAGNITVEGNVEGDASSDAGTVDEEIETHSLISKADGTNIYVSTGGDDLFFDEFGTEYTWTEDGGMVDSDGNEYEVEW